MKRRPFFHTGFFLGVSAFGLLSLSCSSVPFLSPTETPTSTSTLTPTTTPSPTSTITATPTLQPTPIFGKWKNVFLDPFDTNENQWQSEPIEGSLGTIEFSFEHGKYRWVVSTSTKDGMLYPSLAPTDSCEDCYVSVDVEQTSGSEGKNFGLVLRATEKGAYFFEINQYTGMYSFLNVVDGEWNFPIYEIESSAIKKDGTNTISVKAEGSSFSLFINGEFVNQYSDGAIPEGAIGVLISVGGIADVVIDFDNFSVYAP